jgi:hypothetical protein
VGLIPAAQWSADEMARHTLLEQGIAVAVNMRRHGNLIAWAKGRGLFVRVDRATPWGNPFVLGKDGDRATVIARYRDHYLPRNPGLLARLGGLRGKALGCWCAPEACHAEVLIGELGRRGLLVTETLGSCDEHVARHGNKPLP